MENYKTAISCDAGNIQINETHIKCEIHAVHKYVGNLSKTFESEFNTFFHEMIISNKSYLAFRVFAGADLRLDLMNIFAKTAYVYPFTQIL